MPYLGNGGSFGRSRTGSSTVVQEKDTTVGPNTTVGLPWIRFLGMSRVSLLARRTAGAGGIAYVYFRQGTQARLVGQLALTGGPDFASWSVAGRDVYVVLSNVGGIAGIRVETNLSAMGGA